MTAVVSANTVLCQGASKAPAVAQTVDRRVVAGPVLVTGLLAAVRGLSDRGQHLEAFYGCLYYAYLRPSEAVMLKEADCRLPGRGWGRIDLAASAARAGKDRTDDGTARQARGLKHRAQHETRSIPIPPVRAHPRPASLPARPAAPRPAARRRVPGAERRRARHRGRPPRRAQRRRPAQDLRHCINGQADAANKRSDGTSDDQGQDDQAS
jgi:hypothetical protein